jgi:hypothetical protein
VLGDGPPASRAVVGDAMFRQRGRHGSTFPGQRRFRSRVPFQARITAARLPVIAASIRVGHLLAGTGDQGLHRPALAASREHGWRLTASTEAGPAYSLVCVSS